MTRNRRLILQIAFWLAYLLFETYVEFGWLGPSFSALPATQRLWLALASEAVLLPVKISLVYFLFYLFFPAHEKARPWVQTIPLAILAFALAVIGRRLSLVYVAIPYVFQFTDEPQQIFQLSLLNASAIELLFISGLCISIKAFRQRIRWRQREEVLVKEKLESELKFLKAQINPHFLFNTLNNIYALARKQSEATPDAVLKLSKLMRFMLYDARYETIRLSEELRIINDYIELEKMRYNGRLIVTFNKDLDDENQTIAPLLLLHFVENAFKHGASESRFQARIDIHIALKNKVMRATIENTKEDAPVVEDREKIGMENIKRQLQLLYPAHELTISNEANHFKIDLLLPLNS